MTSPPCKEQAGAPAAPVLGSCRSTPAGTPQPAPTCGIRSSGHAGDEALVEGDRRAEEPEGERPGHADHRAGQDEGLAAGGHVLAVDLGQPLGEGAELETSRVPAQLEVVTADRLGGLGVEEGEDDVVAGLALVAREAAERDGVA